MSQDDEHAAVARFVLGAHYDQGNVTVIESISLYTLNTIAGLSGELRQRDPDDRAWHVLYEDARGVSQLYYVLWSIEDATFHLYATNA